MRCNRQVDGALAAGCPSFKNRPALSGDPNDRPAEATVRRIMNSEKFRQAVTLLEAEHDRTVADIVRFTETEAVASRTT